MNKCKLHEGKEAESFIDLCLDSVGLSTSFKTMKGLGIKPFYVGLFAATMVGVAALIMVFALGRFVNI